MADLSMFDLTGKKALVTGGAVGIGRACAVALATAGADVAIVDIDDKTGAATAEDIKAMGRDSTEEDQCPTAVPAVAPALERTGSREDRSPTIPRVAGHRLRSPWAQSSWIRPQSGR